MYEDAGWLDGKLTIGLVSFPTSLVSRSSLLFVDAAPVSTCAEVTTCYVSGGSQTCDVTLEKCPPCIYPNAKKFNCWEYDTEVRTAVQCPFVSEKSNFVDCCTSVCLSLSLSSVGLWTNLLLWIDYML